MAIDAHFPEALEPLFKPTRVLCCREFQASIRESVHRLLADQIRTHQLGNRFRVLDASIREILPEGQEGGSEFIFEGLRHNAGKIRSLEGIDKVWVEASSTRKRLPSWCVRI